MEAHIDHIKTPVHGIVELEFSIFRLLLKNGDGEIVFCQTFDQTFSSKVLSGLNLLSLRSIIWPKAFSLVPNQYVDGKAADYLSLTHQNVDQLLIKEVEHQVLGQTAVYGIEPGQQLQCLNAYAGCVIKNAVSSLVDLCMSNMLKNLIHCHIETNRVWIIAKKKEELVLCNVYEVSNEEEVLYYVSATVEQHFDNKVQVFLSGNQLKGNVDLMSNYLHHVQEFSYKKLDGIDSAIYYQLLQ